MAVTQISRIQIRRGETLPGDLNEGEFGFETSSGGVFLGAPSLPAIQYRSNTYPFRNIRMITEFDLVHTLNDHVVTTGPLQRVPTTSRANGQTTTFNFAYVGDPSNNDTVRTLSHSTGAAPGDLRGRVISAVTLVNGQNTTTLPTRAFGVTHTAGISTPDSRLIFDSEEAGLGSFPAGVFQVSFLNQDTIARWPLGESDSFVMNYSMSSNQIVDGVKVRRTGTMTIAADRFSVAIVDNGVNLNMDPTSLNYMRVIFSGHIETETDGSFTVVLTCTNLSFQDISITFAGTRWAHETGD